MRLCRETHWQWPRLGPSRSRDRCRRRTVIRQHIKICATSELRNCLPVGPSSKTTTSGHRTACHRAGSVSSAPNRRNARARLPKPMSQAQSNSPRSSRLAISSLLIPKIDPAAFTVTSVWIFQVCKVYSPVPAKLCPPVRPSGPRPGSRQGIQVLSRPRCVYLGGIRFVASGGPGPPIRSAGRAFSNAKRSLWKCR